MKAYLDDPKLKTDFLAEIRKHQEADRIIQGTYGEDNDDFKGCAVGCSIRSLNIIKGKHIRTDDHGAYETELGIPRALAYLEDRIFEKLPVEDAKQWPLRFAAAIQPGADLSMVVPQLMLWLLSDETDGVLQYAKTDQSKHAIETVIALHQRKLNGETVTEHEWRAAAADADAYAGAYAAGAAYAADAGAYADAAGAAYAAAYAAYAAAAAAAAAAADAAAWRTAHQNHIKKTADKLIGLLETAGETEGRE